jgi:hypothetical protein
MTNLRAILRVTIVNEITRGLIELLGREAFARGASRDRPLTFEEGEPDFFALLGTENGKGCAWMLADYPQMFGRKVITKAVVDPWSDRPNIWWVLRELPAAPSPTGARSA